MTYSALHFTITPLSDEASDVLCYQLGNVGFESFVPTDNGLIAYAPEYNDEQVRLLLQSFPLPDLSISYVVREIENINWNEEWENSWSEPIRIEAEGKTLLIVPESQQEALTGEQQADYVIRIRPHQSFGTGEHPTTHMLLEDLLQMDMSDKSVLDVGCGTGILSILSYLRGATYITALDIDEWSVDSTKHNALLNRMKEIRIVHGGIDKICNDYASNESTANTNSAEKYDVIFANIHRNILCKQIMQYASLLHKEGTLLLSGFYDSDASAVISNAKEASLELVDVRTITEEGWTRIRVEKRR